MLLASVAIGAAAYFICYHFATYRTDRMAAAPDAELQWLKREFQLDPSRFEKIAALHEAYMPKCTAMCSSLREENAKLAMLLRASHGIVTPEIKSALVGLNALDLECREAMLEHIFAVSREMEPASGERYRQMMESQILQQNIHHQDVTPETGDALPSAHAVH